MIDVHHVTRDLWLAKENEFVAICSLIFFAASLPFVVYVCVRHGLRPSLGWSYLLALPSVRVVSAACMISAARQERQDARLLIAYGTLSRLGTHIALLLLIVFLSRYIAYLPKQVTFNRKCVRNAHFATVAAIGLCIIGGILSADYDSHTVKIGQTLLQTMSILLIVAFFAAFAGFLGTSLHQDGFAKDAQRLFSVAKIGVHSASITLTWTTVVVFYPIMNFFIPSVHATVVMQLLPEAFAVVWYTVAGFRMPPTLDAPLLAKGREGS